MAAFGGEFGLDGNGGGYINGGCGTVYTKLDSQTYGDLLHVFVDQAATRQAAIVAALNQAAGRAAVAVGANAATDVTGFGLLGHAVEMARQSKVGMTIRVSSLRLLPGTLDYAADGCVPGGTGNNIDGFGHDVTGVEELDPVWASVLYDPQTSGGLLISVQPERSDELLDRLDRWGVTGFVIGEVLDTGNVNVSA